ncbi:MAG: mechanosensitive ion channel domain-containing protein [Candidatus Zixiibacteriota bacterium]
MEKAMEWLWAYGTAYGLKIIGAILIFVIGRMVIGIITRILKRAFEKKATDTTLAKFVISLARIILLVVVVLASLSTIGVETTSFIAILGAAGLAVGFALQGSLSNFAAGIMLIIFRPFETGHYIEAGGSAGSVESIRIFNTALKTPDNKIVIVPNSAITGGNIINYSAEDTRRIDMVFGVGYGDDIKKAKDVMEGIINADTRILKNPAPTVRVVELGDSSVNFAVRPWVKTADYWAVYFDLMENIKMALDANGISIPFPQRDVHLYQEQSA